MKVAYWICDRCKKRFLKFTDIETFGLMEKSFELCKDCTDELRLWIKKKVKTKKKELSE